jgi:hypothetical protein
MRILYLYTFIDIKIKEKKSPSFFAKNTLFGYNRSKKSLPFELSYYAIDERRLLYHT